MPLPTIPDYSNAIVNPALVHPAVLKGGHPIEKNNHLIRYSGGFCVVFPYQAPYKKYAVRCWHAEVADIKKRTQIIADALRDSHLPYFVGFDYFEKGIMTTQGMQPVVVMDWVEAKALKKFIAEHINEKDALLRIAENFKTMVSDLHQHHLAHGDLQHGNIMVRPDNSLVLVDYDSMYTPMLKGMKDEIKGLLGYQHKSRWANQYVTEKADYFSELVIYLSLRALAKYPMLWNELKMEDTETMLFSAEDISSMGSSSIFRRLKADEDLAPMVDKLCEFMHKDSIEDLEPLEDAIIPRSEKIVGGIVGKWGNGNVRPKMCSGISDNADGIVEKWKDGRVSSSTSSVGKTIGKLSENISEKFRRQK